MGTNLSALLCLAIASGCIVGEESTVGKPTNTRFGIPNYYGINVAADGYPGGAAAQDLGATWVRLELVDGQPSAAAIADYKAHGLRVLAIVDYTTYPGYPGFYDCGPGGDFDAWRAGFIGRVRDIATSYGSSIDAWEVWNEEDHPLASCAAQGVDYNPGVPAQTYGVLLRDSYLAIREGSSAPVVMGGTDSGQVSYVTTAAAATGMLWADGIAIHPYGVVPDSSWCPNPGEDLNCAWGTFLSKIDDYHAATGLPVWITEFGLKTQDTAHQANYLESAYRAIAMRPNAVATGFYFTYTDAMVAPFGLTYADGTPKPIVYERYRQVAGAASTSTMTSRLHGTVAIGGGGGAEGIYVTAWGHEQGDFHQTYTDALGIYAFEGLAPSSAYNVVVNARFDGGTFVPIDGSHALEVRDNVSLVSGPDGWHGEDFELPY